METIKTLILKIWNWVYSNVKSNKILDNSCEVIETDSNNIKSSKPKFNNEGNVSTHKITKSILRLMKKEVLIKTAKTQFNVELDSKLTKSKLVNRVYELYHRK